MTPEQARECFSEAWEGSLARGDQHAFERALAADPALREEYGRFVEVARSTRQLGGEGEEAVNLLPSLQARLRAQSKGRFFRDRFAQQHKTRALPVLAVSAAVVLIATFWLAMRAGFW